MEKALKFRAVIEMLGKPQQHIEDTLKEYIKKLREDKRYAVVSVDFAEARKQPEGEYWAAFAEVEVTTSLLQNVTLFCFEYMPSSVEMIGPQEVKLNDIECSTFFNDLQARLHQLDMIAKQTKTEVVYLRKNVQDLLRNFVKLMLQHNSLTSEQLSNLIGLKKEVLEDFLDTLIDKQIIVQEGEMYRVRTDEEREPSKS